MTRAADATDAVSLDAVRACLRAHRPSTIDGEEYARAAVALILREGDEGAEFLAIRRTERSGDPWSGHMALPGGRASPSDADATATARRETREEIGVDLERHGRLIGRLDELQAVGRGRPLPLVIRPLAFELTAEVRLELDDREVQSALWVPLAVLCRPDSQGRHVYRIDDVETAHPAFVYRGHTIWGLTYRILQGLLELLG